MISSLSETNEETLQSVLVQSLSRSRGCIDQNSLCLQDQNKKHDITAAINERNSKNNFTSILHVLDTTFDLSGKITLPFVSLPTD